MQRIRQFPWRLALFATGMTILAIVAFGPIPEPSWEQVPFRDAVRELRGFAPLSDLVQDIYGMRALQAQTNPYIPVEQAATALGIEWLGAVYPSTHPPTAFLFTAPIAGLPWAQGSALWAWAMLALLALSLRLSGLSWLVAVSITPILLIWWPTAPTLGQLVVLWLVFALLAYHFRHRPLAAGAWIGVASLTKFLPAVLLLPFVVRREWKALFGFALVWAGALLTLWLLSPAVFDQYLDANRSASPAMLWVEDNVSLIAVILRSGHVVLLGGLAGLLLYLIWLYWPALRANSLPGWWLTQTLAVVLLPISWHYSLIPLFPVWIGLFRQGRVVRWLVVVLFSGTVLFGRVHLSTAWSAALLGTLVALVLAQHQTTAERAASPVPVSTQNRD